jgi:hypothetical protein
MSLVKDGLAQAWAEHLGEATGLAFFPQRHDGETSPPFGVVVVKRLLPTVPGDDMHLAELRVVVVSDAAETGTAEQQARLGAVYAAIEATPRQGVDEARGVRLCGFVVEEIEPASGTGDDGKRIYSDVILMRAGAGMMRSEQ